MKPNIDELRLNQSIHECPDRFNQIRVEKTDLDTIGSFFLHKYAGRIDDSCLITCLRSQASPEDLTNPQTLCLECGGSGQTALGNFDHHQEGGPEESATLQTLKTLPKAKLNLNISYLASYIDNIDRLSPEQIREKYQTLEFPTLSDIISGINLKHSRSPETVMKEGERVIRTLINSGLKPTGPISGFNEYAELKKSNDAQIELVRQHTRFIQSHGNTQIGYLQTTFFGAPGIIYEEGRKNFGPDQIIIAVAHNPQFGPEKNENKFTIGLNLSPQQARENNISLKILADQLNNPAIDPSVNPATGTTWGGPPTGTIIGSPKGGSTISLEKVIEIIKKNY